MKIFTRLPIAAVLFASLTVSPAFATTGQWVQVMPAEQGFELINTSGCGNESYAQVGNMLIIKSGDAFNDVAVKKSPQNIIPLRDGEKLYLINTKDPAILSATFPGARVVYREMGYIIVAAGETAAMNLMSKRSDFTMVEPLPENQQILTPAQMCHKTPSKKNTPVAKFLEKLDMQAFMKDLEALVAFKTRLSYVAPAQQSVAFCENLLKEMGYQTRLAPFRIGSSETHNVIAEIKGTDENAGEIIIGGHLDSTSQNPRIDAPGADDNGSGAAGVIALARLLKESEIKPAATIKFVLFMGEEQGLYGSKAYVNSLKPEDRKKIRAVLTMDMIGFDVAAPLSIMLETNAFNKPMAEKMLELAKDYASFSIQTSYHAWGSDHAPFLQQQIPAMLTIESEYDSNPNYHKTTDLIDSINPDLCENIMRLNAAAMFVFGVAPEK